MTDKEGKLVLKLCNKLASEQLIKLGAYLMACAYHGRKPLQGTIGLQVAIAEVRSTIQIVLDNAD